jgi:vacuolar protein sorting-associated protein 26
MHIQNRRLLISIYPSDARRYFKQSEIVLYRQAPEIAPTPEVAQQQQIQQQLVQQQQAAGTVGPSKNPQLHQAHAAQQQALAAGPA